MSGSSFSALRTKGLDKSLCKGPVEAVRVVTDEVSVDGEFSVRG